MRALLDGGVRLSSVGGFLRRIRFAGGAQVWHHKIDRRQQFQLRAAGGDEGHQARGQPVLHGIADHVLAMPL